MAISTQWDDGINLTSGSGGLMVSPNFAGDTEGRRFAPQKDVDMAVGDALKRVEISDSHGRDEISDSKRRKEISDLEIREDEIREEWSEMNIRYSRTRMIIGQRTDDNQEPGSDSRSESDSKPGPDSRSGPSSWSGSNSSSNQSTNQSSGYFSGQNQKKSHSYQPSNNELKFNHSMTENFQNGYARYEQMMSNNTMPAPAPRLLNKYSYNQTANCCNIDNKIDNNLKIDNNAVKMVRDNLADIPTVDIEHEQGLYFEKSNEMMNTEKLCSSGMKYYEDAAYKRGILKYEECERNHDTQLKLKLSRLNLELSTSFFSGSITDSPISRNVSQSNDIYGSVSSLHSYESLLPDHHTEYVRCPVPVRHPILSTVSSDSIEYGMRNIDPHTGLGSPLAQNNHPNYVNNCGRSFDLFPEVPCQQTEYVYPKFPVDNTSHPYISSDFRSIYDDCMYVQHSGSPKRNEIPSHISESDHSENAKKRKINTCGTNVVNPFNKSEFYASELIVSNVIKWLNLTDSRSLNCLNRCTGKKLKM